MEKICFTAFSIVLVRWLRLRSWSDDVCSIQIPAATIPLVYIKY